MCNLTGYCFTGLSAVNTLPKFVHIYEMIIPEEDEEPLCLKLQNSYTLQLTEEEIESWKTGMTKNMNNNICLNIGQSKNNF